MLTRSFGAPRDAVFLAAAASLLAALEALAALLPAAALFAFGEALAAGAFFAGEALMLALTAAAPPLAGEADLEGDAADFAADLLPEEVLAAAAAAFGFGAALAVAPLSAEELVALLRAWRT